MNKLAQLVQLIKMVKIAKKKGKTAQNVRASGIGSTS